MTHHRCHRAGTAAAAAAIVFGGALAAHAQSLDVDRKLGAEAAAEVESTYGIVQHEEATAWVAAVGERRVAGLGPQPFAYSFRLVSMTEPNAFAVPAGHVFVAPSLLSLAAVVDEDLGKLLNAPLSTMTQLRQASYSRGQEKESGHRGAELSAKAG